MMNMTTMTECNLVHVNLKDYVFEANLEEELGIDTDDILSEVLTHSAKIAMWSVLHKLSQHKVDMIKGDKCQGDLNEALENREFLAKALEAFNHRKSTLIRLCTNPQDDKALVEYHTLLHDMGVRS